MSIASRKKSKQRRLDLANLWVDWMDKGWTSIGIIESLQRSRNLNISASARIAAIKWEQIKNE